MVKIDKPRQLYFIADKICEQQKTCEKCRFSGKGDYECILYDVLSIIIDNDNMEEVNDCS